MELRQPVLRGDHGRLLVRGQGGFHPLSARTTCPTTNSAAHSTSGWPVAAAPSTAATASCSAALEVGLVEGDLRREPIEPRGQRQIDGVAGRLARRGRVAGGAGAVTRRERGAGRDDQEVGLTGGRHPRGAESGRQILTEGERLTRLARRQEHVDEHLVGVEGRLRIAGRQPDGPPGRRLGADEGAVVAGAASALREMTSGRPGLPRRLRQVGGQLERRSGEPGVGPLVGRPRPRGQVAPLRWEQVVEHRLTGQRVPEPEPDPVDLDQLLVDGGPQPVDRRLAVDLGDPREQLPVEAAAQERGGAEHSPSGGIERAEAAMDGLAQAGRHGGRQVSHPRPLAVLQPQLPRRHQPGKELLDEERAAVAVAADERDEVVGGRGHVEAGGDHAVHLRVGEAVRAG